jgi:hypothetical protein
MGGPRFQISLTPKDPGEDLEGWRTYFHESCGVTFVVIEDDGTLELSFTAKNIVRAEDQVKSWLGDDRSRFIIGHPPL